MDRAKFIESLRVGAVKLVPYTPPGFEEPIYLKPMSMADIKEQLTKADEPKEIRERMKKDGFYIERSLARVIRGSDGELLFDEKDDVQMAELKAVLDNSPHNLSRLIHEAHDNLINPTKDEADPKGN